MKTKRIFLTGFMGAGKSTIGSIIANTIGWDFYDLDHEIEKQTGMKIVDIFKEHGESYFRDLEGSVLTEIVKHENIIVALGGGAILFPACAKLVKEHGVSIYLKSSPEKIYSRLRFKTDRPLFQTVEGGPLPREKALEKIKTLLAEREKTYNNADLIYDADRSSIGQIVDELKHELLKRF